MGEGESQDKGATAEDESVPRDDDAEARDEDDATRDEQNGGDESADETGDGETGDGGSSEVDISDTPAPSIGPKTTFDKRSAEERLSGHEQSDQDAMGLDKRRQIIGGTYGPTKTRQMVTWLIAVAVIGGAAFGLKALADDLDKPPAKVEDQAPWTGSHQKPPPVQ